MNPSELTCIEIATLVAKREITASDVVSALIERTRDKIENNAFSALDSAEITKSADNADRIVAEGGLLGALHGVPLSFKDNINVAGYATTAGTLGLKHFQPSNDAPVVTRLKSAGAIVFGKNNMHELAYGATTNNALFGPARNPFDPGRVCGGSSGGSACAVAARTVPASIGTDTGGSLRVPASFCGLWSFRPSTGRWPKDGIVPISKTRDTPGPIARTPSDLALLDSVVVGHSQPPKLSLIDGLRIGVPVDFFWDSADPEIANVCRNAMEILQSLGAVVVEISMGNFLHHHLSSTTTIAFYEGKVTLEAFLSTYDVGRSFRGVAESVAAEDVRSILMGQLSKDTAIPDERYLEAIQFHRPALQDVYRRVFRDNSLDVLAFPTSPVAAPVIGQDTVLTLNGKDELLFPTIIHNTDVGSNAGIPGITMPVGTTALGLPVGLALDAAAGADRFLLDVAICLEAYFPALVPVGIH